MRKSWEKVLILTSLLLVSASAAHAEYKLIAPKSAKKVARPQEPEAISTPVNNKASQLFKPASSSSPCPNETDWLLTTAPLTNTSKVDDGYSRNPGSSFLPENMQKELIDIAAKENISLQELCGRLKTYKTRLEEYSGDPAEYNRQRMLILEEMLDCRKSCGKILSKFAGLYTESSKAYFQGLVRFNTGSSRIDGTFKGDRTHGGMEVNNDDQLKAALAAWKTDPSQRIQLDARSSLRGSVDLNDRISRARAESVLAWLTSQGVPQERISIRWLGKYGPLINRPVANSYRLDSMYASYEQHKARQTTSTIGSQGLEAFFDGINQSVAIFVLP